MKHARDFLALTLSVTLAGALWASTGSAAGGGDTFAFCLCTHGSPCDNEDDDSGCLNSAGVGGTLTASGSASLAADDLFLMASDLPLMFNTSLLIASPQLELRTPFGSSLLCVGNPLGRIQVTGGFEPLTFGPVLSSINNSTASFSASAGDTIYMQAWYRDIGSPQACGIWQPWGLTNGIAANVAN